MDIRRKYYGSVEFQTDPDPSLRGQVEQIFNHNYDEDEETQFKLTVLFIDIKEGTRTTEPELYNRPAAHDDPEQWTEEDMYGSESWEQSTVTVTVEYEADYLVVVPEGEPVQEFEEFYDDDKAIFEITDMVDRSLSRSEGPIIPTWGPNVDIIKNEVVRSSVSENKKIKFSRKELRKLVSERISRALNEEDEGRGRYINAYDSMTGDAIETVEIDSEDEVTSMMKFMDQKFGDTEIDVRVEDHPATKSHIADDPMLMDMGFSVDRED